MGVNKNFKSFFSSFLLRWNSKKNNRRMPWKGEKDPYKIWLSEIILQQTRVEQGTDYYLKFINEFPNIHALAAAPEDKVYKLWEGLGYYTRCTNLIKTAKYISKNLNGKFPGNYDEIIKLSGVGSYTASAIASFAYNLPYPVVDGNVFRVLARVFGIKKAIDSSKGKVYFKKLAYELLDKKKAGEYNQAIMDFGAVICKPVNPQCSVCCFKKNCIAFQTDKINKLPVKEGKLKIKHRWFYYLIIEYRNKIYINKRTGKDIWKNLYEFLLIETNKKSAVNFVLKQAVKKGYFSENTYTVQSVSIQQSQLLSHQKITGQIIKLRLTRPPASEELIAIPPVKLTQYAFPGYINQFLKQQPEVVEEKNSPLRIKNFNFKEH